MDQIIAKRGMFSISESDFHLEPNAYAIKDSEVPKLRRQAILATEELLCPETSFKMTEVEERAAKRINRNSTRERWKNITHKDIVAIVRLGRINMILPEE